ncbi:hypothetical protein QE430_002499 [Microbacterium testaceum]|uniref:hypothetical protein n=1 Tax=Microbacterium testaceum TaxID=2033 RepID=UPI00277F5F51|nr:hypothetical protein [Microbacterium testaceum]MDQ1174192.1 hypothetical protein [Microbacterium testaceum]
MMRVLTVQQPWADCIVFHGKTVENRTRNLAGSYRGPVAIHAGLRFDENARVDLRATVDLAPRADLTFGAIIGVVDLVDAHPVFDCITQQRNADWTVCSEWAEHSGYHLVFTNPRPLETPLPFRGGLSLRHLDEATERTVLEGLVK